MMGLPVGKDGMRMGIEGIGDSFDDGGANVNSDGGRTNGLSAGRDAWR
jgi:hypothetical protein